jgi:hypothetical protein
MIDDDLLIRALLDQQIADAEHIAQAKTLQSQDVALTLYDALIHHDILPEPPLVALVAGMLGLPHIDLDALELDPGITGMLSSSMAARAQVLPISLRHDSEGSSLQLAMLDPFDLDAMDEVAVHTGINIQPMLAGPRAMQRALIKAYPYVAAPIEPAAPLGQEDSWAMFFEGNAELGNGPEQPPAPLSPQLGGEESAVISQDMRDRPTSMEFDLLDLEEDPQPPMLRTMYLEEEDVVELGPLATPPARPPAMPPVPAQDYAEIGNFFVDHDMRKSGPAEPTSAPAQNDADFFDSFFSEEALRAPAEPAAEEEEESPFILTDEVGSSGDRFHNELDRGEGIDWSMLAGSANQEASKREIEEAEEAPAPSRWTHDASRSSIQLNPSDDSEPMILLDTPAEEAEEPDSHTAVAGPSHFARPEPAAAVSKNKLAGLRARLGQRDEDASSHTAIAGPLPSSPPDEPAPEDAPAEQPRKLSLGKLGSSLSRPGSTQVASPASLAAGLLKKAPAPAAPEPEPAPEPTSEPAAPTLGKLQLKKIPVKPLAIEEHYAPRAQPTPEPATRAFNPDAATREMTDADLFSFVPTTTDAPEPEPAAAIEPLRFGAQTPVEEAMLEEHTRARVVVPTPVVSGRSFTDTPDRPMERVAAATERKYQEDQAHDPLRETSANTALTRASLLRMSRQTSELDSPKTPVLPDDLTERQLLHAALSLLIEHGVLSLDDLIKRARKL